MDDVYYEDIYRSVSTFQKRVLVADNEEEQARLRSCLMKYISGGLMTARREGRCSRVYKLQQYLQDQPD